MTRTVRSRRAEIANQPLYARVLRLRHLAPSGLLCFVFLEGAVVLGILLALAELVSWWGVLVLPVTVALMVKFNDLIAGALTQQPLTAEPATVRASVSRHHAASEAQTAIFDAVGGAARAPAGYPSAPAVEQRMTGPGFGFAPAGSGQAGAVFGFPGSEQPAYEGAASSRAQPAFDEQGSGFEQAGGFGPAGGFEQAGGFSPAGGFESAGGFGPVNAGSGNSVFGISGAGQAPSSFGYIGSNSGEAYGDGSYAGYGTPVPAPMPATAAYGDEPYRAGFPAAATPIRRQWADEVDVRQQMARQSAVRRYE